jgi:hypothetical protein
MPAGARPKKFKPRDQPATELRDAPHELLQRMSGSIATGLVPTEASHRNHARPQRRRARRGARAPPDIFFFEEPHRKGRGFLHFIKKKREMVQFIGNRTQKPNIFWLIRENRVKTQKQKEKKKTPELGGRERRRTSPECR